MEGPSLVIACEEFAPFVGRKVRRAEGTAKLPFERIEGKVLRDVKSWGKHFLLVFDKFYLRIHFLMFGSYRIDNRRENRDPKLSLLINGSEINFYSCAIKLVENTSVESVYDWSTDIMSDQWDEAAARKKVKLSADEMVCDVLMDQDIFTGLGNIIKNEVLFNLRLHPEARIGGLTPRQQRELVREARDYSFRFYEWKKKNVLKRNWRIFRKRICPRCDLPVEKRPTGAGERISHFCSNCQLLPSAGLSTKGPRHSRARTRTLNSAQARLT